MSNSMSKIIDSNNTSHNGDAGALYPSAYYSLENIEPIPFDTISAFMARYNNRFFSSIILEVVDNKDGTATLTWRDDAGRPGGYYRYYYGGSSNDTNYDSPKTYTATINDPSVPKAFKVEYYDADDVLIATSNTITKTITGDTDGASFNARLVSAGRTLNEDEAGFSHTYAKMLRDAGLTANKVEFSLMGWGVGAANLLRFYSGSAIDYGTNTHNVAGKVTLGPSGAININLIPSVNGYAGFFFYRHNSVATATNDMFLSGGSGGETVLVLPYYGALAYVCYGGAQGSQQKTGTANGNPGLFFGSRASATAQEFSRNTTSGKTVISNAAISGTTGIPTETLALGCYRNTNNNYSAFSQNQYCLWGYQKAYLTTTQRDDLIDIMISWLLDLGWIT